MNKCPPQTTEQGKMIQLIGEYDYENDLMTYYEHRIQSLERKRMRLTIRGRLSSAEDHRLDEINSEIMYWIECLDHMIEDDSDWDEAGETMKHLNKLGGV